MHVVDWDSYIMQWRDLLQHLIGHVDIDADLSSKGIAMARDHGRRNFGPEQRLILEME